jgi:4-carboxymuconolactone decarboxylase
MAINAGAKRTHDQLFGDRISRLSETDPELVDYFGNFAFGEVYGHGSLDARTTLLVILAGLVGSQAQTEYRILLGAALDNGVSPVEAKEVVYHAGFYLGIGRVYDFLAITNQMLTERGIPLPLPGQSTTSPETRFAKGWEAQVAIIGDRVQQLHDSATPDTKHIQKWLTENCFGDNYTRTGIALPTRELLTFVLLVAQGGCDSQAKSHVAGNVRVGNDRQILLDALSQLVPYIGYPRTLNGLAAINEIAPAEES